MAAWLAPQVRIRPQVLEGNILHWDLEQYGLEFSCPVCAATSANIYLIPNEPGAWCTGRKEAVLRFNHVDTQDTWTTGTDDAVVADACVAAVDLCFWNRLIAHTLRQANSPSNPA